MISLVIPAFNEEAIIPELFKRLEAVASIIGPHEIILIDDGSHDQTVNLIKQEMNNRGTNNNIRLISFGRNFGHQIAISAGIDYAQGDAIVILDADLQDPPEVIAQFIERWKEGWLIAYGVRRKRKEHWIKRTAYSSFYRIMRMLADVSIPLDAGDFCLMDRKVINAIKSMPERNRFLRGLRAWTGFPSIAIEYERAGRFAGEPKYTVRKLIRLATDGIFNFSTVPLKFSTYVGFIIAGFSVLYAISLIVRKLIWGINLQGWSSLMVMMAFLGGVQLFVIGILGEYIGRIYKEVQGRPLYTVKYCSDEESKQ